jgi:hypothetical protein
VAAYSRAIRERIQTPRAALHRVQRVLHEGELLPDVVLAPFRNGGDGLGTVAGRVAAKEREVLGIQTAGLARPRRHEQAGRPDRKACGGTSDVHGDGIISWR